MTDPRPGSPPARPARPHRRGYATLAVLGLITLLGIALYLLRQPIGGALATQYLRAQGVESAIAVDKLTLHGFSGRLRLGPAADPDASADRIDVDLTIAPPWSSTPLRVVAHRIRLVRPKVKMALRNGKVSFGGLDRLIPAARPGALPAPLPDLVIEDGVATIATPAGAFIVHGGGETRGAKPIALDIRADPATLGGSGWSARTGAAHLVLHSAGSSVSADLDAPIAEGAAAGVQLTGAGLHLNFSGNYSTVAALAARGRLSGRLQADSASGGGAVVRSWGADLTLPSFGVSAANGGVSIGGQGGLGWTATTLTAPGVGLTAAHLKLDLSAFQFALEKGAWLGRAAGAVALGADQGAASLAGAAMRLNAPTLAAKGTLAVTPAGLTANLAGSLFGRGGLDAVAARRLAQFAAGTGYEAAAASALTDVRLEAPRWTVATAPGRARLVLGSPVQLVAASGARISLGSGPVAVFAGGRLSGALEVSAGSGGLPALQIRAADYSLVNRGLSADVAIKSTLDLGPVRQARIDATGRLRAGADGFAFTPSGCLTLGAERATLGEAVVAAPVGRLCPIPGAPLIGSDARGWRASGRIEDAGADLPTYQARIDHIAGRFEASGAGKGVAASLHLDQADVADTAAPQRFRPQRAGGEVSLTDGLVRGVVTISTAAGHRVGQIDLRHSTATGVGEAIIGAPAIRFVRNGFQPSELTPLADPIRRAEGEARFSGRFDWTPRGMTSSGEFSTSALDVASPVGAVSRITADIHLTSLLPLTAAPGQTIGAQRIEAVVPLEQVRLQFGLDPLRFALQSGRLETAGGEIRIEPLSLPLAGAETTRGVIVLAGIDLGKILAATSLADKAKLDAVVDGRLPFEVGPGGFKLLKGAVVAVRPGKLSIQRDVFVGAVQPNAIQDFAYQAMAGLAFDSLDADIGSRPGGRLGVVFHIKGRSDPAVAKEAYLNVRELVGGTAFNKPIPLPKGTPIDLTLDTSLNFDQLLDDYQKALSLTRPAEPAPGRSVPVQP